MILSAPCDGQCINCEVGRQHSIQSSAHVNLELHEVDRKGLVNAEKEIQLDPIRLLLKFNKWITQLFVLWLTQRFLFRGFDFLLASAINELERIYHEQNWDILIRG